MARVKGVPAAQAGLPVKIAYYFTRRALARLTGRQTRQMIEPLEIYALLPPLFRAYARLEQVALRFERSSSCVLLSRRHGC